MLKCEKCGKNKVYVTSDLVNAWCQNGCGFYTHMDGVLIYIGQDESLRYCVKQDGHIKSRKVRKEGNTEFIEEERLVEIENV